MNDSEVLKLNRSFGSALPDGVGFELRYLLCERVEDTGARALNVFSPCPAAGRAQLADDAISRKDMRASADMAGERGQQTRRTMNEPPPCVTIFYFYFT